CHGFANTSKVKGADGNTIVMNSGNTYRMKPDGTHVEQYTWGQVNPFGLTTDSLGYLYTSDCHSEPIYQLIRGAYYPSFGKPHDGLGFGPQMFTGYKGSTAIAGIAFYDADAYPAAHRGTAFVGDVVTNQIVQFRMTWQGATPSATEHVFMDCKDRWFRPVDVKLGPDGALYIADFYNRIIGHYEVPLDHPQRDRHRGRIWRIVYTGKDVKPAPVRGDWTAAQTRELLEDLQHPNIQVRLFATHSLVQRGGKEVIETTKRALGQEDEVRPLFRAHALWVLERLGALDTDTLKREAAHPAESVRVHARRILADRNRWTEAEQSLALAGLGDPSPHVQRVSAEAVGLHADPAFLRPLLDLRQKVPAGDTHRLHTVRLALRNQLRPADAWKTLGEKKLSPEDAKAVADVALGVPSAEASAFLVRHLSEQAYPLEQVVPFAQHVARHGTEESQRALLAFARGYQPDQPGAQAALARAVDQGTRQGGRELSGPTREWVSDLTRRLLASREPGPLQQGIELTRDL
ncbi:MAG: PQQ-dependent sugar dehydrogenase, partial [Gemmataceae bacterium]